jgi:6-pyruvoyltetrahydropterin/6-carboxytetrahydropterin synthase
MTAGDTIGGDRMTVYKVFKIHAAHWLPNVSEGHKCRQLHGHTFKIEVHVKGPVRGDTGWVMDFAEIGKIVALVEKKLDHTCLNDIPGLDNPTSENLAIWIWKRLQLDLPGLAKIVVQESRGSGCIYEGE